MSPAAALALLVAFVCATATDTRAALPGPPAGARSHWVVEGPREIVTWLLFDPATVRERLPARLRFITAGELADGGVAWAAGFVHEHPARSGWGISFLEIVRADTFTIDGRGPRWPVDGAAALWMARVAPADPADDLGPGQPYLTLDLWLPDREFVATMRAHGHHASVGAARLRPGEGGRWSGSVRARGLAIDAMCVPVGPVSGGERSAGVQAFFPPATSPVTDVVRIAFAGHRVQHCDPSSWWRIRGAHPLARAIVLGESSFEYGYHLRGGAYPR